MPASSRFAVACHVLTVMGLKGGEPVKSDEVAARASTNPTVIRKLMSSLHRAGITRSVMGQGGGNLLNRAPETVTLADVYRAVEEGDLFGKPRCAPSDDCPVGPKVHAVLAGHAARAQDAMLADLGRTTLADLMAGVAGPSADRTPDP
ncbi:Rrf2 family transcriptional regulator [Jannaschia sp. Os4]|uniref:Rrf2 family transcriptional regulator n=1 Tax=Jannaschia sp. Os4 TaxID=2807617 RepID=UPI001939D9AC|nr:Rrf2 family transcriptional regulator [Jannaschia sp. Os4]MBM2575714.1 Rrf2 family transcriptional regulator [Jannaschia sp. Os4]